MENTLFEWAKKHKADQAKHKIKKTGYFGTPGNGPAGERCVTCLHFFRNVMAKTYFKCSRIRASWSGGPGTDIKAKSPACEGWEKDK